MAIRWFQDAWQNIQEQQFPQFPLNFSGSPKESLLEMRRHLTTLMDCLNKKGGALEGDAIASIPPLLAQLLDEQKKVTYFFNKGRTVLWEAYLSPLERLKSLLSSYLNPSFDHLPPSLQELQKSVSQALAFLNQEIEYQRGIANASAQAACDGVIERVKDKVHEVTQTTFKKKFYHPFEKLRLLIIRYQVYPQFFLKKIQETNLEELLCYLDQNCSIFEGLEDFIYEHIKVGLLHQNLTSLSQLVRKFIKTKIPIEKKRAIYLSFYEASYPNPIVTAEKDKVAWTEDNLDSKVLDPANLDRLWGVILKHVEEEDFQSFQNEIQAPLNNVCDFNFRLLRISKFLKRRSHHEQIKNLLQTEIPKWFNTIVKWLDHKPDSLPSLQQLNAELQSDFSRCEIVLKKLQEFIQSSHLYGHLEEELASTLSPIKTFESASAQLSEAFEISRTYRTKSLEDEIKQQTDILVEKSVFYGTFLFFFNYLFRPSNVFDPNDLLTFNKNSDEVFRRIIQAVEKKPKSEQWTTFFEKLKEEIDHLRNVNPISKLMFHLFCSPVMQIIHFFVKSLMHPSIQFLISHLSITNKHPLSDTHLAFINLINRTFIEFQNILCKWANDKNGEEFGTYGRFESLEKILKEPTRSGELNFDELIKKTTKKLFHQFMKSTTFSNFISKKQQQWHFWINEPEYLVNYGLRLLISIPFRICYQGSYVLATILENISTKMIRGMATFVLIYFDIPKMLLTSWQKSYSHPRMTNAIDKALLTQARIIKKDLETEENIGSKDEYETVRTLRRIREMVKNWKQLIDENQLTKKEVRKAKLEKKGASNVIGNIKEEKDKKVDEQLVNIITTLTASTLRLFTEQNQFCTSLLLSLKSINDSIYPTSLIRSCYGDKQQQKIVNGIKHTLTDNELKNKLAKDKGVNVSKINDQFIEKQLRIKFGETQQQLTNTVHGILDMALDKGMEQFEREYLTSPSNMLLLHINWIQKTFFGPSNYFKKTKALLEQQNYKKNVEGLYQETFAILTHFRLHQKLLDDKVNGQKSLIPHLHLLNRITHSIIPDMMQVKEDLEALIRVPPLTSDDFNIIRNSLKDLEDSLRRQRSKLQQLREIQENASKASQVSVTQSIQNLTGQAKELITPLAINGIKRVSKARLKMLTDGTMELTKDSVFAMAILKQSMLMILGQKV